MRAFDLDRFQFFILDEEELILADLIASPFVFGIHRLARRGIHELLLQAVAGLPVHLPERDPLHGDVGDRALSGTR